MSLFKNFGKVIPLYAAVMLLFCVPAQAEEKITLSTDDSFYTLAHKMIDFGAGIGGYYVCKKDLIDNSAVDTENVVAWLDIYARETGQEKIALMLMEIMWNLFKVQAVHYLDLLEAGETAKQKEMCDVLVPLYERLEFPKRN